MYKKYRGIVVLFCSVFVLLFFVGNHCPIEHIMGIPCPGCNMFTALYWLFLQGNIELAQYYHPAILPLLMYGVIVLIVYIRYREHMSKTKVFKISSILFLGIFLGVYIYRMFTIFPQSPMQFHEQAIVPRLFHLF